jgi:hypothetical protein
VPSSVRLGSRPYIIVPVCYCSKRTVNYDVGSLGCVKLASEEVNGDEVK